MSVLADRKNDPVDPNVLQRQASDPDSSIWVSASAGTGKTKVLTDRVLRLLLPRFDGRAGTPTGRILCLTFTKAAANEMALRVQNILSRWTILPEEDLRAALDTLMGYAATDLQYGAARKLFAENIDSSGGLRIMTIHSFCQSVLGRFPLESSLSPYFTVLDEGQALTLLKDAQADVLKVLQSDEMVGSALSQAMYSLLSDMEEARFLSLIMQMSSERTQLGVLMKRYGSVEGVYAALCAFYSIPFDLDEGVSLDDVCAKASEAGLRHAAEALLQDTGKNCPVYGQVIINWLESSTEDRKAQFNAYQSVFLTAKGEPRIAGFPTKRVKEIDPNSEDVIRLESLRLESYLETKKCVRSASMTRDLLLVGTEILGRYDDLKKQQGVLDFDDLVIRTMDLLKGQSAWVMYKLDEGLDHILVDEAQDTNPEQWGIIEALCQEFFDGYGARGDVLRTSFTVGDVKQSIYSFQRAAPAEFRRVQNVLDQRIKNSGQKNDVVALETSFRTTESVLRVVDGVFADHGLNAAVGGGDIQHISFRKGQAGRVELWPLFETEKKEVRDPWAAPIRVADHKSASAQLAEHIASNIRNWLDRSDVLESCGRAIEPGDIMILVRSRNAFVEQIMRALKQLKVPVAGSDRMILGEQLAVQDLIVVARFCLLPEDDLSLAEVLKSPFIGLDEDDIFALCYARKGSLWQEICNFDCARLNGLGVRLIEAERLEHIRIYLAALIGRVRQMNVYEFFSYLLTQPCPVNEHSGFNALKCRLGADVIDPVEEFLNEALTFGYDSLDHMQLFLEYQNNSHTQIKREMEEAGDNVRIMTVHGSKGLQAPIVILPDTILSTTMKKPGRFLWPHKTGLDFPLYSGRNDDDPTAYSEIYKDCEALDEDEYYRLLYVAMTRAEDRLYVCGHVGLRKEKDYSWYHQVRRAMEADDDCIILEDGTLRVENSQDAEPDRKSSLKKQDVDLMELPVWAKCIAQEEPMPPRPLVPSQPLLEESEVVLSPLIAGSQKRFKRGNITHKLLQFLPDFDESVQENAAQKFVQKHAGDLSDMLQDNIVREVMGILQHDDYAPFFAKGSIAEVSVTGLMDDGRIVSGQIDRLIVTDDEVWILDYKSNRPPPENPKDVQAVYKKQLIAYRDSIVQIYKGRSVHCALLWTDGPRFMIMDDFLDI